MKVFSGYVKLLRLVPLLALLWQAQLAQAQQPEAVQLAVVPVYGRQPLVPEKQYALRGGDSVQIDELRFYVSGIGLYLNGQRQWQEPESYHLLDLASPATLLLTLHPPAGLRFDQVKLYLGIDSATNVSGALSGDLDPAKGMYWTWQSGYINIKLEGRSNRCPTRKHRFQFHLGGYLPAHRCLQQLTLPLHQNQENAVQLDLDAFLEGIDLAQQNEVMIPGKAAVALSEKFAGAFKISRP